MMRQVGSILGIFVALFATGYYVAGYTNLVRFSFFTIGESVQQITVLFWVTLVVERTVEVFISGWHKRAPARRAKGKTRRRAFFLSVVLGAIVAIMGVRALGLFVDPGEFADLREGQRYLFHALDMILTVGLIAGGSDGLHQLTSLFTTFLKRAKKNVKGRSTGSQLSDGSQQSPQGR